MSPDPEALAEAGGAVRILIVEDDEGLAELEAEAARSAGFAPVLAADLAAAEAALRRGGVDLALIDYALPDGEAPRLIERFGGAEALPPFVVTTGRGDERIAVAMMKLGARDYLVKDGGFLAALADALARLKRELAIERELAATRARLAEAEARYRLISENVSDVIFIYEPSSESFSYFSPSVLRLLGCSREELDATPIHEFLPPEDYAPLRADVERRARALAAAGGGSDLARYRVRLRRARGGHIRAEAQTTLVLQPEGQIELLGVLRDVEERERMEEDLVRSLREKEVLLKEVHHRVKNNLQIVSSLINLQLRVVKHRKAAEALVESQNRIRAMALIHEQLYRSVSLETVPFAAYVREIVPPLVLGSGAPIATGFDLADANLPLDLAVPCGLILNELVTNAVKHAFRGASEPRLRIAFGPDADEFCYRLEVGDNGPGLPEGYDPEAAESLGFTLVSALAGQLAGRFEYRYDGGAVFVVVFPSDRMSAAACEEER